jgi:hypothetical protein
MEQGRPLAMAMDYWMSGVEDGGFLWDGGCGVSWDGGHGDGWVQKGHSHGPALD